MLKKICLFLLLKKLVFNYIVLPIKILPKENYRSSYEINSPKDIINNEYLSTFFTELEMGDPVQKVPLLLKPEVSSYIITSINSIENSTSYKYVNTFNLSKSFFSIDNYTFYNEKKSNSFILNNCDYGRFYEAEEQCNSNETFYFYQDINDLKNKTKAEKLYFELMRNVEDNITGEIGLNYYDRNKRSFNSFLEILKSRGLIQKYVWFFDMESYGGNEGRIVIGSLPHEVYPDNYDSDDLIYENSDSKYSFVIYWKMLFNKIYIKLNNNNFYFNDTTIEFKFDSNVIIATSEYEVYISNILDKYISTENCFNDSINDIKFYSNKYRFYYCKNTNDIKKQLYELLPKLHFYSSRFNYTFEIGNEDLLKIENEYIYYKVLFNEKNSKTWYLGKPISLKYKFVFNPESKLIGFYRNYYQKEPNNNIQDGNNLEIAIKIIIIILLCMLLVFLGIKIGKILYGMKRKKRANELIDDYDYESHDNNKDQNNNVGFDNNNCINN